MSKDKPQHEPIDAERRFRALFEKSPDAFMLLVGGVFTDCNEAALALFGARREEIVGRSPHDFSPPTQPDGRPSREAASSRISGAMRKGTAKFEWVHRRLDGVDFWADVALTTLPIDGGNVMFAAVRDVTERKRAVEALRALSARQEAILAAVPDIVMEVDAVKVYTWANRAGYAFFGDDVIGREAADYFVGEQETYATVKPLFEGDDTVLYVESWQRRRDGEARLLAWWCRSLKDGAGKVSGALSTGRDITESRRAEEELRGSEERYRKLIDASPQGIFIVEGSGRTGRYANPEFRRLFGYPADAIQRLRVEDLHPEEELPAVFDHFARMLAGRERFAQELRCRRADGTIFFADVSAAPIVLAGEQCVAGLFADVTARKHSEERRREIERRLLHAQKLESMGVLAGGIAHDFNNLLTAILGNLDLALEELPPDAPVRGSLEKAIRAANGAADLTRQMLAYSGKGRFVLKQIDLNEAVRANADLFRSSVARTASLVLRDNARIPLIEADPAQIQQVMMNLVTNASEAIGDRAGTITLTTGVVDCGEAYLRQSQIEEKPEAGRYVFVEVADDGCGMDDDAKRRLFEPFYTTKFTGRGLGMSVVLGIVRGHRGAIFVESEAGRGTTIRALFPASAHGDAEQPAAPSAARSAAGTGGRPSGTILFVDDEAPIRAVCAAFAERSGFRALVAADGEAGLELFRKHADEIACVILDLTMPRMDGLHAFKEMKRLKPEVRVLLTSGYSEQHATRLFGGEGLAGFLEKPYRIQALEEKLIAILRGGA
jgi:two-component system, cell cycle sensor histidine kinase and response regulator CckA